MKVFATCILICICVSSKGQSDQRFIEVAGVGEVRIDPNAILLSIDLREYKRDGTIISVAELDARLKQILDSLGIRADDLEPGMSDQRSLSAPAASGEEYRLRLTNPDAFSPLAATLREAGVYSVEVIEATHTDMEKYENEARVRSINNAREKALLLAAASSTKLGRILQIREVEMGTPRSMTMRPRPMGPRSSARGDRPPKMAGVEFEPITINYKVIVRFTIDY